VNPNEVVQMIIDMAEARVALMARKASDYANEDALANFKRMSLMCDVLGVQPSNSAADCALFLALLKIDRWCNLRRKGTLPENESVLDTIQDLHNYIDLAYACQKEEG